MEEINTFDLPEITRLEINNKIEAFAWDIRSDWSDPRTQCREIIRLCEKLQEYEKKKLNESKDIVVESDINLDKALSNAYREQYLKDNPRGYTAVTKSHRNRKKYNRKSKHKNQFNE